MRVESFDPVVGATPRALILGSMPGRDSLEAAEYYAHSRNVFWRILADLDIAPGDTYDERIAALGQHDVALWDVLKACDREGSLDSEIVRSTEQPNDIPGFLREHPTIRALFFNGSKAEKAFRAHVAPDLSPAQRESIALRRLPSTSPAHAVPYERKLTEWRALLLFLGAA